MAVKTITITEEAYKVLRDKKGMDESFSRTILRVVGERPLDEFIGILSKGGAERLEKAIRGAKKQYAEEYQKRIIRLATELGERHGSS